MQSNDSHVLKYADYFDPEEPNPFNDEAYTFLIEGIQPNVTYYYYVRASAPNMPASSLAMYNEPLDVLEFTWKPQEPGEAVEPPGQIRDMATAQCPGDLSVIGDDIHIAYVNSTSGTYTTLVYARYDNRDISAVSHYDDIDIDIPAVQPGAAGAGVKLSFKLDVASNNLAYSDGKPLPIIAFSGAPTGFLALSGNLYSSVAIPGLEPEEWTWQTTEHNQTGEFPFVDNPCPISYAYYDAQGDPAGLYLLGYIFDEDWRFDLPNGGVWYKHRNAENGYWSEDDGCKHSLDLGSYVCFPGYRLRSDLNYRLASKPGWSPTWPALQDALSSAGGGNPYSNMLYLLTGSPRYNAMTVLHPPIWDRIRLWKLVGSAAVPPENGFQFSSVNVLDIIKGNPDWNRNGASYGPISHEVVATSDYYTTSDVYVGFCNSVPGELDGDTDTGLRVLHASDNGFGPSGWTSPNADEGGLGIIDADYRLTTSDNLNTARIFDIAKRHESEDFPQPYDGLGCVYIDHVNGKLILAETVNQGGNLEWQRVTISGRDHVDQGALNWACLDYDSYDIPYVLYARSSTIGISNAGNIYLWKRP